MTDSPRLEEVFAAVLAEHHEAQHARQGMRAVDIGPVCVCGVRCKSYRGGQGLFEHQAERLAARFEQVGWWRAQEGGRHGAWIPCDAVLEQPRDFVPVFRLVGGDQ